MAGSAFIQFRETEEDKRLAVEILGNLGTNLSTMFNGRTSKRIVPAGFGE